MTVLDWWLLTSTITATAANRVFVARYFLRYQWERSVTGRSIMALSVALTLCEAAAVARRIDELSPKVDLTAWVTAAAAAGWTVVTAVFVWRNWALTHPQDGARENA